MVVRLSATPPYGFVLLRGRAETFSKYSDRARYTTAPAKKAKTRKKYSSTVILPSTSFPRHIDEGQSRIDHDEAIKTATSFDTLYAKLRSERRDKPEFILHDGPPYANGDVHIGHAVNKILKDITNRYKLMSGFQLNYIPGWDCHGLPIELKALEKMGISSQKPDPAAIREAARTIVAESVEKQKSAFRRWGILADWKDNVYMTTENNYEASQVDLFWRLYTNGYIYRDKKPVYWSPASQSSLAEAELEYNENHRSTTILAKFKMIRKLDYLLPSELRNMECFAVIWTTTPWSIPGNLAVVYDPHLTYVAAKSVETGTGQIYFLAKDCFPQLESVFTFQLEIVAEFAGSEFANASYQHPIYDDKECPFLPADYVSARKGSGLVHTAPAHGQDDYLTGIKDRLDTSTCFVDELGRFSSDIKVPEFIGKEALTEGTDVVIGHLKQKHLILHINENYIHSYPYDWRTKTPVILRASEQWFIDVEKLKPAAAEALSKVRFLPGDNGQQRMLKPLMSRPYWCISRQRSWGVPIPVFYSSNNQPLINEKSIGHVREMFAADGSDDWNNKSVDDLLPASVRQTLGVEEADKVTKGTDILDIWFESGTSWAAVVGEDKIADVCIEGHDQYGAWFQTSLLTSVALRNKAPFKTVYVHGFALDEGGRKMSKSLGNVVHPDSVVERYGADVLRLWVAQHGTSATSIHFGQNITAVVNEELGKLRNVFRFLLGTQAGFSAQSAVPVDQLLMTDRYMVRCVREFQRNVNAYYQDMLYNKVVLDTLQFVSSTVSSLYCSVIKDRLYCEPEASLERRSAQTAVLETTTGLTRCIAPIAPHLAEEVYRYLHPHTAVTSILQEPWNIDSSEMADDDAEVKLFDTLLEMREQFHKSVGSENPMNFSLMVFSDPSSTEKIDKRNHGQYPGCRELDDLFGVSSLKFQSEVDGPADSVPRFRLELNRLDGSCRRCARCRKRNVFETAHDMCERCLNVTGGEWAR